MKLPSENLPFMKTIEDYLHFYIGVKVIILDIDGQVFEDNILSVYEDNKGNKGFHTDYFGDCPFYEKEEYYQEIKPVLRLLKDITNEELIEVGKLTNCLPYGWITSDKVKIKELSYPNEGIEICVLDRYALRIVNNNAVYFFNYDTPNYCHFISETFDIIKYLIDKRFDLFGLIESGLAIKYI